MKMWLYFDLPWPEGNNSHRENDAFGILSVQIWKKSRHMFLKTPKNFIQAKMWTRINFKWEGLKTL